MRKVFFTLLFVGVCLTSVAATPRLRKAAVNVDKCPDLSALVEKIKPSRPLLSPVMCGEKNVMSLNSFFTQRGVTPDDNMLMKNAPKRISSQDLLSTKIAFMECYEMNETTGEVELADCYYDGGWDVEMEQLDDNEFGAYVCFSFMPVGISVDYASGSAEMMMDYQGWHWSDTVGTSRIQTVHDTTKYVVIANEEWFLGESDEFTNLSGTLYNDGSLYFPDGWCYCIIDYVTTTVLRNGSVYSEVSDTSYVTSPIYRNTYLMTPNAVHDYDVDYSLSFGSREDVEHEANNVYMFQYDDTTAVVWNIWGLGGRGTFMYIHDDGSMVFPAFQVAGTVDVSYYEEKYPEYDWSEGNEYVIVGYDLDNGEYYVSDIEGEVTQDRITWGGTQLWNYCTLDGVYYALQFYPMFNNVLAFVDGESFVLGGSSELPVISSEVYGAYVLVTAEPTGEDGVAYLFNSEGSPVDNPCEVSRTDEDQYIMFYAVESDPGKNVSELVVQEILVPALDVLGDVNGDREINLQDVIALIDGLVNGAFDGINIDCADVDQDGQLSLNDVIDLINMITMSK